MRDSEDAPVRAIFLDVDGTYADYGIVPDAHVEVVRRARKAGNKVFLCTGRPMTMLTEAITGAGFDGVVASAGAYVVVGDKVLVNKTFPHELAQRTVAALDANNAVYVLENQESLYVPPAALESLHQIIGAHFRKDSDEPSQGAAAILNGLESGAPDGRTFAKAVVFDSPVGMNELIAQIGPGIAVVENSIAAEGRHAGELFQHGLSKADGIAAAIAHLGISQANTVAFGDGENDLEMVAFAGIGVAIEGSSPALLALADRTAKGPRDNGLVYAFEELGLV